MSYLLDTHVLLWWLVDPDRLSTRARDVVADGGNVVFVSAASIWEIEIKAGLGKLRVPADLDDQLARERFQEMPIRWAHSRAVAGLANLHRDPFDRILVAQARVENVTLVSDDPQVLAYDCKSLSAG